jgi:hypothetical protein
MSVRSIYPEDLATVIAMMRALWPTSEDNVFGDESVFVWERMMHAGSVDSSRYRSVHGPRDASWNRCRTSKDGGSIPICDAIGVGRALVDAEERWCLDHCYH